MILFDDLLMLCLVAHVFFLVIFNLACTLIALTPLHSERPKRYGVLAILSAIGLMCISTPFQSLQTETIFVSICLLP